VTTLELVLVLMASAAVYFTGLGAMFRSLDAAGHNKNEDPTAVFGALFWPLAVFIVVGSVAAARLTRRRDMPVAKTVRR
jgi:hypothetical protein